MSDIYIDQDYISCGFFDAIEISPGVFDRTYSADTMSKPYTRIISNGIFPSQTSESDFKVVSDSGMDILIRKGEGIFNYKWFELTQGQVITVPNNDTELTRIDSVIVEINMGLRIGRVIYRTGTPAEVPQPPELTNTENIKEYRIANIEVISYATEITDENISDRRGIETPFIASLVQTLNSQELFTQWTELYSNYFRQTKENLDEFMRELTEELTVSMSLSEDVQLTTVETDTTEIEVTNYDSAMDIMWVFVNSIKCNPNEFSVDAQGTTVTFENVLHAGTVVSVNIIKSLKAPGRAEGRYF